METQVRLELMATLKRYQPVSHDRYPITPGTLVRELMMQLNILEHEVNVIFVDGIKGNLDSMLSGGERVAFFPPLGGG